MNKEFFEENWNELRGKIKKKWIKLTDSEISSINGEWENMLWSLEKKYGYKRDQAERELKNWKYEAEKAIWR